MICALTQGSVSLLVTDGRTRTWYLRLLGVCSQRDPNDHHLTEPGRIAADLRRALRPGGHLVIIDFLPRDELPEVSGVQIGHGVRPESVIAEVEPAGFRLVQRRDDWQGRSERCVFRSLVITD